MTENKSEDVLCARILDMPIQWLGPSVAIPMREDDFFSFLDHTTPLWIERSVAENDDNFKQLIPYILLTNSQGLLATYPRRGTEARLHGSWSLGLGGHINTSDQSQTDPQTWRNLLYTGLKRELSEEFPSSVPGHTHFLGVINENLSAVGRVHLGVVFLHQSTGSWLIARAGRLM